MSNVLKRFRSESVGTGETDIDYLPTISPAGDFTRTKDINAILNSWNNILLTPRRSYPYDPEYGSDLYKMVFEPLDDITAARIQDETVSAIRRYDDRADIESVNISFFKSGKGFTIDMIVNYDGETKNLSVTLTERTFSGFFTVEN